jgi:acyl-CoA synthetase (AMP-forming)/AMP-acid ligase II
VFAEQELTSKHFEPIAETIESHARRESTRDAIIFLERGETESGRLTYGGLAASVDAYAGGLIEAGYAGRALVISLPAGDAFVALFIACLKTGTIAVPAPYMDSSRSTERLSSIVRDCHPIAVITDAAGLLKAVTALPGSIVRPVDDLSADPPAAAPSISPDQPAFIQYTSGSTQAPKGIVITQGNLTANHQMIHAAFAQTAEGTSISWLPHFHDMGLIGAILQPLYLGAKTVLMAPRAFIQKPVRWLNAIEKYGGTAAGGPSFAYDLCTRMISDDVAATLDLSSWEIAYCGSEPVRIAVLEKFARHFRPSRFRENAFLSCYGLAETTLIAASVAPQTGVTAHVFPAGDGTRSFVNCGKAVENTTIVLRDEDSRVLPDDGSSGEICIAGAHVSPGRWDGAKRTVQPFANTFVREGVRYLATGDIGRMVSGELYPVDRINDLIILYGAKIHAADVEATVLDHAGFAEIRSAAAFAVDDGSKESLVVLCEVDRTVLKTIEPSGAAEQLRNRVAEVHGVVPQLRFVAFGALPRTSSGKIQRSACKTYFLSENGGVSTVASEP